MGECPQRGWRPENGTSKSSAAVASSSRISCETVARAAYTPQTTAGRQNRPLRRPRVSAISSRRDATFAAGWKLRIGCRATLAIPGLSFRAPDRTAALLRPIWRVDRQLRVGSASSPRLRAVIRSASVSTERPVPDEVRSFQASPGERLMTAEPRRSDATAERPAPA